MAQGLALALLGASSLAAENLLRLLEDSSLPLERLLPLDEASRAGRSLEFKGHHLAIDLLADADFSGIDIALATVPLSLELQRRIQEQGCTLVAPAACLPTDGTDEERQLLLPGQNLERTSLQRGMQVVLPNALDAFLADILAPVEEEFGLKSLSVVWTRPVSHDGRAAVEALAAETAQLLSGRKPKPSLYRERIAFQVLPEETSQREADFLRLWQGLWGRHQLAYSLQTQIVPVFFGDVVNFRLELETEIEAEALETLFKANAGLEMLAKVAQLRPGVEAESRRAEAQARALVQMARPRQVTDQGAVFITTAMADLQLAGAAATQVKCAESLAKNLFFS